MTEPFALTIFWSLESLGVLTWTPDVLGIQVGPLLCHGGLEGCDARMRHKTSLWSHLIPDTVVQRIKIWTMGRPDWLVPKAIFSQLGPQEILSQITSMGKCPVLLSHVQGREAVGTNPVVIGHLFHPGQEGDPDLVESFEAEADIKPNWKRKLFFMAARTSSCSEGPWIWSGGGLRQQRPSLASSGLGSDQFCRP